MPDQSSSEKLLFQFIKNESLRKHCFAVESAMRFYAGKTGEDQEMWASAGLLHDLDWEIYPETHPNTAVPILKEAGYNEEVIDAILGHAYPDRTNVPRHTNISKYLFACDEITGFIMAYSLMKPGGLNDVEPKNIKKKLKDKAFARNVNRDDIINGIKEVGIDLDEHLKNIIEAMKNDPRLNSVK
ncbi:MAG: HDIG domain-containing metalloprotein [Ignavibacteria bacterium]